MEGLAGTEGRERLFLEMAHAEPKQQQVVPESQPPDVLSSCEWASTLTPR